MLIIGTRKKFNPSILVIICILTTPASLYSQQSEPENDTALVQSTNLESQILSIAQHKINFGNTDPELTRLLVQLAASQSRAGDYSATVRSLEEAFEISRINDGLYHASQIPIVDELIANEILLENWSAVNNYYGWQENLFIRLYGLDDPRLEAGLEKITAWHMSAYNEDVDNESSEHLRKARDLLEIRLEVIENVLGSDNPRYNYLQAGLAIVNEDLRKIRMRSRSVSVRPVIAPVKNM